jgi:hypothetical protein
MNGRLLIAEVIDNQSIDWRDFFCGDFQLGEYFLSPGDILP